MLARLKHLADWALFHALSEPYRICGAERDEQMASMQLYPTSRRQVRQLPTTEKGMKR